MTMYCFVLYLQLLAAYHSIEFVTVFFVFNHLHSDKIIIFLLSYQLFTSNKLYK